MKLTINRMTIYVWEGVYPPSEDTFLLLDHMDLEGGELVLDVGTGTGILAVSAALRGCIVVAVDVSLRALKNAKYNAKVNGVEDRVYYVLGDVASPLRLDSTFDVVLMNPPYLPSSGIGNDPSWNGGPNGISVVEKLLKDLNHLISERGKLYLVLSSLSRFDQVLSKLSSMGFTIKVKSKKKFWFEEIMLVEAFRVASHKGDTDRASL